MYNLLEAANQKVLPCNFIIGKIDANRIMLLDCKYLFLLNHLHICSSVQTINSVVLSKLFKYSLSLIRVLSESKIKCRLLQKSFEIIVFVRIIQPQVHKLYCFHEKLISFKVLCTFKF